MTVVTAAKLPPTGTSPAPAPPSRWQGSLELALQECDGATRLTRRRHCGPLLVQRPFYPEGPSCCHIYLLHPPGGLVGGDSLNCSIELGEHSHALVTTPSAGKAYRVAGCDYEQGQHTALTLAAGTALEWLPQEAIAFDGARPLISTRIDLDPTATIIGWDILCLGRPGSGERFTRGRARQELELWCAGQPLLLERAQFDGRGAIMDAPWGLRGQPVSGTLYACWPGQSDPSRTEMLALARQVLTGANPGNENALLAATVVNNVLLIRYLGACTEQCRLLFTALWQALRPALLQRQARTPRIWNT